MYMSLPRRIVAGGAYMVTRRCTQRQFLLRPDPDTTNAFIYCLTLAAERARIQVVAFLAHSNHHHTIVVDPEGRLPEFLEAFHKLLAKHQNALRGRWENFWAAEATSVVELVGSDDVLAKVIYALTNPVKDHLVERAEQWPGASSLRASLSGWGLRARRPHRFFRKDGHLPEAVTLRLVRAPGFERLTEAEWRTLLANRIRRVEHAMAEERQRRGTRILGRAHVLRQRPTDRPTTHEPRRGLNPRFASRDRAARVHVVQRNKMFLVAYRAARDLWQAGLDALFPPGTYWLRRFAGVPVSPAPA